MLDPLLSRPWVAWQRLLANARSVLRVAGLAVPVGVASRQLEAEGGKFQRTIPDSSEWVSGLLRQDMARYRDTIGAQLVVALSQQRYRAPSAHLLIELPVAPPLFWRPMSPDTYKRV